MRSTVARPVLGLTVAVLATATVIAQDSARFDSAEAAVKALVDAAKSGEKGALSKIFGDAAKELVSGDDVQDKADLISFAKRLADSNRLVKNEDGSMTLEVGRNAYPFPIPLVQKDGKWIFDTVAGTEEILNRRIGENELSTIAVCRAFLVAQREYAQKDWDADDVLEYAQILNSSPGKKDGLFWETGDGEPLSPLGGLVAQARGEGYLKRDPKDADKPRPYHGYLFRILTKQGGKAPGGKFDYVINGNMIAGFALVAWPVDYDNSGVMTFIVNSNGRVYQKDLGEKTAEAVAAMQEYERDETWAPAKD